MRCKLLLFLLLIVFFGSLKGEEQQPFETPANLPLNWWDYFSNTPPDLQDRIQSFLSFLDETVQKIPQESQTKALQSIEEIKNNFSAYVIAVNQKPKPLPPVSLLEKSYTIASLLEIHKKIGNKKALFQVNQSELSDFKQQISTASETLERLYANYRSLDSRSVEKFLEGLKIIAFRISLETARIHALGIKDELSMEEEEIKRITSDEKVALKRLSSSLKELETFQKETHSAKEKLDSLEKELDKQQTESVVSFSFWHENQKDQIKDQIQQLQVLKTQIQTGIAKNQWILKSLEQTLSEFLISPNPPMEELASKTIRDRNEELLSLNEEAANWEKRIEREILRTKELAITNETKTVQQEILLETQSIRLLVQSLKEEIKDSQFILDVLNREILASKGTFSKWVFQSYDILIKIRETLQTVSTLVLFHIGTTPINLLSIFTFLLIFMAALWISRLTRLTIHKISSTRRGMHRALAYRVNRLIHYTLLFIGIIIGLAAIGFDFSSFVLIAGALGVGLGFGLQSIFNNFFSGLIILFESQLKVGDYIQIETGIQGEVKEINFRSTYLQTNDGLDVIVPNSEFINHKVINWTLKEPFRRIRIPFSVSYDSDKEAVVRIVEEAAKIVPYTLQKEGIPPPKAYILELAPNGINFELGVWIDPKATKKVISTNSVYLWAIHEALVKHGISIPYPQRTIHFANDDSVQK